MPEPIIDPEVPERQRTLLLSDAGVLRPPGAPPGKPPFGGRTLRDAGLCLSYAPVWTLLPAVMGRFYGGAVMWAGLAAQAVLAGLAVGSIAWGPGLGGFLLLCGCAMPLAFGVLLWRCGEGPATRLARTLHGRYVRPQDLGEAAAGLLERAREAVGAVLGSEVNRSGLLDDVRNAVTLPAQLWEIALTLAQVEALRAEHEAVPHREDHRIADMLGAQAQALDLAAEAVTRRVAALEDYAAQAAAADEALRQWETARRLSARSDAYRELLARTVRDELAVAQIAGLTEEARRVEEVLRASVRRARRAGLALAPGPAAAGLAEAS
ncbi:hypothetical protein AB0B54_30540 [Microbispora bryophytorum]|uniref:hypothetical protein n=1 Tax=Microbispora bryophytorum TaxID=1460882 RepID=UPI0033CE1753